jgi:DNA-binding winged helix-turn-helix (wHTH) protein/tetratricopeptide (TPR) repeat protein
MGWAVSRAVFRFGLFEADPERNALTRNGVRIRIQDQPFRALTLFLENPGEILTREQLRQKLWPEGTYVDFDNSLNVILKKLRAALEDDSENPRFVETVPKRGYRFIAPVSVEEVRGNGKAEAASAVPSVQNGAASPAPRNIVPAALPENGRRPLTIYVGASAVLLMVGAIWFFLHGRRSVAKPYDLSLQASAQVPLRRSVAVLGFHNISGRAEDAWLSVAVSEMLSTELAGGEKLRLVSGQEVANLRVSSPWPETDTLDHATTSRIGAALNTDLLILGSYATVGSPHREQLRLDVRLQDARTGEILTEAAQTGERDDLFQLVAGVGAGLRTRLGIPKLVEPEQSAALATMPSNREAARLYSLGLVKLREFDALAARDLLQQACAADPKFALSHAMLARAWNQLGYEQKRREEAKKALDLSTTLSRLDRMQVEGDYYESLADHEKAASTYRAMFELFPDDVEYGLQLAVVEHAAGHDNQASQTIAQLRRLPPPASDDPRIDLLDVRVGPMNDPARLVLIRSAEHKATVQGKKVVYAQARKEECENVNYSEHPDQAPQACDEAYNIFMAVGNRLGAADAIRMLGDVEGGHGDPQQAIATYERALKILQELGEDHKTGAVLNNMAIIYENEGNLDRAEQLYREAKSHFEQAGDKRLTVTALGNIADILFLRGNLAGAGKLYQQAIDLANSLDHSNPGYLLFRLADLNLAQGRVADAHRLAQQGVDAIRANQGGYGYLSEAMVELGAVLMAEANLSEAHRQFQSALELDEKVAEKGLAADSHAALAELALEEGHPDEVEPLMRPALAEFEQDKSDPSSAGAYTVLSRALLALGRLDEARTAVQKATVFSRTSSDPALKIPAAIQSARVEMESAEKSEGRAGARSARAELRATIASARKLGYYELECEARLALGELELKQNPAEGRSELTALATEARHHGLELVARKAEQVNKATPGVIAVNKPLP